MSNNNRTVNSDALDFHSKVSNELGNDYQSVVRNNPYMSYYYKNSLWDSIGDLFGFHTNQDKVAWQYNQSAKDYDAQIMQMQMENDYNSPSAQAQRMRQAGQNPDLLGTASVAESSEFNQEQMSPNFDGMEVNAGNFVTTIFSCLDRGFDIASKFFNLEGMLSDLDMKNLNVIERAIGVTRNVGSSVSGKTYSERSNSQHHIFNAIDGVSNKRNASRFRTLNPLFAQDVSVLSDMYEKTNKAHENRYEWRKRASSRYKGGDLDDGQLVIDLVVSEMADLEDNLFESEYSSRIAKNYNDLEYEQKRDAVVDAEATNMERTESRDRNKVENQLNSVYRSLIDALSKYSSQGNKIAQGMLIALLIARGKNIGLPR